jgi:hypothetical protein
MYQKTVVFLGIIGVTLSLILGLLSIIAWQIVAVLITVSLGIPSLVLTYEKFKSEVTAKPKEGKKEQGLTLRKKETLREETILASPNEGLSYEFTKLVKDDHLKGEIVSTERIDIYFIDSINFDKWDRGVGFEYEDCNEAVLETKIDYLVPKRGTWYVVIENNGRKIAKVKVHLY